MDKDNRVSATCPICHEGELRRMDGPPEWYVLPAATLSLSDDDESAWDAACQLASASVRVANTSPCFCRQPSIGPKAAAPSQARSRCARREGEAAESSIGAMEQP
jgi:hypothetical protein